MPLNSMPISVRPEPVQTVYLNMNKVNKLAKSKQGLEAGRRFEENLRLIDFWHPQDAKFIKDEALQSLQGYINAVFTNLNPYEKSALVEQIRYTYTAKMNSMINALDGVEFFNVGKAGDEVLKCAMERDRHIDTIEGILNEVRIKGQKNLNQEQLKAVELEYKQALAYDRRRLDYVAAGAEARKKNLEIAESKGPEVLAAYHYLYDQPKSSAKK